MYVDQTKANVHVSDSKNRAESVNLTHTTDAPDDKKENASAGGIRWRTKPPLNGEMLLIHDMSDENE